jgi:hypothetical protein
MSITWMCVVALFVLAQKLLHPRAFIDAPLALTIIAVGARRRSAVVDSPSHANGVNHSCFWLRPRWNDRKERKQNDEPQNRNA